MDSCAVCFMEFVLFLYHYLSTSLLFETDDIILVSLSCKGKFFLDSLGFGAFCSLIMFNMRFFIYFDQSWFLLLLY